MKKNLRGMMVIAVAAWFLSPAWALAEEVLAAPAPGSVAPAAATMPAPAAAPAVTPAPGDKWSEDVNAQLGLAQSSFDNWSQGGENSLAWQASLLSKSTNDALAYNWATTLKLSFGQIKSGEAEIKKSQDEINLESVVAYKLGIQVDPYLAVKGLTQFTMGYDYSGAEKLATSAFMDPGYFIESIGFGYTYRTIFKTRLGFAVRETLTNLYPQYADNPATGDIEKTKVESGAESVTDVNLKISDVMSLDSTLALFSNLKASDQIVVRWDNLFGLKLAKYLAASFNLQLIYDKTVSTRRQLSQAMTLGLTYQFDSQTVSAGK